MASIENKYLFVSGSELPVILGDSDYNNIWDLARQKLKLIERPYNANRYTRNGQFMEPKVRDYINNKYGFHFKPEKTKDLERYYSGNCDGLDRDMKALIEIKTFMNNLKIEHYRPQCELYMELFDIPVCLLVGYKTNDDFFNGNTYIDKNTGEERDSLFESCYNTNFDPTRVVIHRFFRDKEYFNKLEKKINIFQNLVSILNNDKEMSREIFYDKYYSMMSDLIKEENKNGM